VVACFTVLWGRCSRFSRSGCRARKSRSDLPSLTAINIPVPYAAAAYGLWSAVAWGRTSFESLKRNFRWPAVGAVSVASCVSLSECAPGRHQLLLLAGGNFACRVVTLTVAPNSIAAARLSRDTPARACSPTIVQLGHRNIAAMVATSCTSRGGHHHWVRGPAPSTRTKRKKWARRQLQIGTYTLSASRTRKTTSRTTAASGLCSTCSKGGRKSTRSIRASFLQGQPANRHHGGQPLHFQRRPLPGV